MVKIKTSPENKNKVTISDLNSNIVKLTKVMQDSVALNKTYINDIQKAGATSSSDSSSSKKSDPSWYAAAGSAMWKATAPERGLLGSTIVGGLTGINPAIVQKMGIDKAIGSIFKSIKNDIKEKWAAAGLGSSNSKKVNSAIEANKVSPVTSRLDKIIKLMGLSKKTDVQQKSEGKGFLGKLFSFLGSVLGPLLKIAAGLAIFHEIAQIVRKIAEHLGIKDLPTVTRRTGQTAKGLSAGAQTAKNIVKTLSENEGAYTKALRNLQKNEEFKKLKPAERAALMSKQGKGKAKVSNNLQKLVNELHASEGVLDEGLGTKNAKNAAKVRAANYVNQVEPLPKKGLAREASTAQKVKANVKLGANKTFKGITGALLSGGAKAIDKVAGPIYATASGIEVGSDILQGDYREAVRDTAGAAAGWWGAAKGGTWGAAKGAALGGPKGAITLGILGALGGGYGAEKVARFGSDIIMDLTLGPEAKKNPDKQNEFVDALMNGTKSKVYQDAQHALNRRHAVVDSMRNPNKIKEIMLQYNLTSDEFIDEYLNSSIRGRPEAKRKAAVRNLERAGVIPISEEYWRAPMNMPGTYLNTDFNTPSQSFELEKSPINGIEQNTSTTNEILKNILSALETGQASAQRTNFGQLLETSELRRTMGGGNSGDKFPPNVRG